MFELKIRNADGGIETFRITGEHPVHVEDWVPSTVEELLASLSGNASPSVADEASEAPPLADRQAQRRREAQTPSLPAGLAPYAYFPSEESTKFGAVAPVGALGVRAFQTIANRLIA